MMTSPFKTTSTALAAVVLSILLVSLQSSSVCAAGRPGGLRSLSVKEETFLKLDDAPKVKETLVLYEHPKEQTPEIAAEAPLVAEEYPAKEQKPEVAAEAPEVLYEDPKAQTPEIAAEAPLVVEADPLKTPNPESESETPEILLINPESPAPETKVPEAPVGSEAPAPQTKVPEAPVGSEAPAPETKEPKPVIGGQDPEEPPCDDDTDFTYRGKGKKNCDWISNKSVEKIRKLCNKRANKPKSDKTKIWEHCKATCVEAGMDKETICPAKFVL